LIDSAKKTSRVIVLDEGYGRYGVTAELAAVIAEGAFYDLDAPVKRNGGDARSHPVFPAVRRRHGAYGANSIRCSQADVQAGLTLITLKASS